MMREAQINLLPHIEINPMREPIGCVIFLHGLGADGSDFVPIVKEFHLPEALSLRFIFPHAPQQAVTINQGYRMPAWYDIVSMSIDHHADQKGIKSSIQLINALIEEQEKRGIPSNKIILGGFSQGAVIALMAGLSYSKPLAGMIALSGYLPNAEAFLKHVPLSHQTIPIFLAHGKADTVVPFRLGEIVLQALNSYDYPVTWKAYEMAHSVCPAEIVDIAEWLKKIFM